MALINFYKGLKENYSPDTHGNSIYSCTDTNECYILGVLYENISEQEIADKIGTNTYTNANYISKETNLTDAAMQLDEEIKATNDNIAILNAATVKSVKVGSNTTNEQFSNGVITIANATTDSDGALSKEVYNSLSSFSYITSFGSAEEFTSSLNYPIRLRNIANGTTSGNYLTIPVVTTSNIGLMSKTDKTKLDNIENTYLPLTGGTITGGVRFDGDVYLNHSHYIHGVTSTGSEYPILFIDSDDTTVVSTNGTPLRIRSNNTDLVHNTPNGNYTIYDSHNLDINKWNVPQYTGDYNLIAKSGLTYWNNPAGEVSNVPAGTTNNPYGIMATFGNFEDGHLGESNVWGFQLANPNNSDSLWYRDFKGLTKNPWKELAFKEDTKSLVFTQSAGANETNAANYLKVRDGYFNIVVVHSGHYYTPNEINTSNPDSIAISFSTFTTTGYNIYQVIVTADGTCTESLYTSFTIPTVNVVNEFPTELDNYADGSIFIKE